MAHFSQTHPSVVGPNLRQPSITIRHVEDSSARLIKPGQRPTVTARHRLLFLFCSCQPSVSTVVNLTPLPDPLRSIPFLGVTNGQ